MVVETSKQLLVEEIKTEQFVDLPEEELRWCSVSLNEIYEKNLRLEASVFDIEGRHAWELVSRCKQGFRPLCGNKGLAVAYYGPRFKRIWVEKSDYPIFQPSQILEINPKPTGFLSRLTPTDLESLRVKKGQVLLTRSGTIGNCTLVSETFNGKVFSDDVIRIDCTDKNEVGYVYIFLRTKVGNTLLRTNQYGSVVSHIEPEHLERVIIPNCPVNIKKQISEKAIESFKFRDESNALFKKAEDILVDALDIKPIDTLKPKYFERSVGVRNYCVKLSQLNNRCEGSYHVPIVEKITALLKQKAKGLTCVGDKKISARVFLPSRFKRVYVEEGQGTVFFGGKQTYELDPSNKKYLSLGRHSERIEKELKLKRNMILITRSGTIGKVVLVPEHWESWVANEHMIRIEPASEDIAGYVYVFLNTDYGLELTKRFTYGSVVDEIDAKHVSNIPIPLLKDGKVQGQINSLALLANERRFEAYQCEQNAMQIINDQVIHL